MKKIKILFLLLVLIIASCISIPKQQNLEDEEITKFKSGLIYSDGTAFYRSPEEPLENSSFLTRIRVKRSSATEVNVVVGDSIIPMVKESRDELFDYYTAQIKTELEPVYFYYHIKQNKKQLYYSRRGVELKKPLGSYRFKVFPGFVIPDWSKGAVLYQIYVDRFNNGDTSNDVVDNEYMYDNWPSVKVNDWDRYPDSQTAYEDGGNRTREFYGGDLEGVIQKLDYLDGLGIDGIYFNPLFVSPSNHKYDSQDYDNVDPHIGVIVNDGGDLINPEDDPNYKNPVMGNASSINKNATKYIKRVTDQENLDASNNKLKELISKFHEKDMKVILDGVFNHSGSFNKWLDRESLYPGNEGAYESKDSKYKDYFLFSKNSWPGNESYEGWWGYKTLPKLNFEDSKELENNILDMSANWVSEGVDADGWRLDVAADLGRSATYNHKFWQMFRDRVKGSNNEAVIYAEVYGDSSGWLNGNEWDSVMNYDAFFEPISFFLTGLEKHSFYKRDDLLNNSKNFEKDLREKMAKMPYNSLMAAMNQLDNHDHSRFLTRTSGIVDTDRSNKGISFPENADVNHNYGILKEAVVMQMTLPGAPTLYYGNEAGVAGFTDPDSRRTYPWGNENQELLSFYKDIIGIHKEYSSFINGSMTSLYFKDKGIYSYGRWNSKNRAVVVVNNNDSPKVISIPVDILGSIDKDTYTEIYETSEHGQTKLKNRIVVVNSKIDVTIPAYGTKILISKVNTSTKMNETIKRFRPRIVSDSFISDYLVIEFDQLMIQKDIETAVTVFPEIPGLFSWNGNKVSFKPENGWESGRNYIININRDVRSVIGELSMEDDIQIEFVAE